VRRCRRRLTGHHWCFASVEHAPTTLAGPHFLQM
jgi:hypothetical protein